MDEAGVLLLEEGVFLVLARTGVLCDELALLALVDFGVETCGCCCCCGLLAVEFLLGLVAARDVDGSCTVDDLRGRFRVEGEDEGREDRALARDATA